MIFNKAKPIEYPISILPGQVVVVEFKLKGGGGRFRVNTDFYVTYLLHPRGRSTNMINSGPVSIYNEGGDGDERLDRTYTVKLIAPNFNVTNAVKSVIFISTDSYRDVVIDDLIVDNEGGFEERKGIIHGINGVVGVVPGIDILGFNRIFEALIKNEKNLPLDSANRIFFIRPWTNDSFALVGWFHIYYIDKRDKNDKNYFEIIDSPWEVLKDPGWMNWTEKRNILLHPFLYPFAAANKLHENINNFGKLLGMKNKIGGFDVSDSDKISSLAVSLINKLDLIMVPSSWCKDAYIRSGVNSEIIEVLEHGISDEFVSVGLEDGIESGSGEIKMLRELKKGGNILVLFFCTHSEWRKGADLVSEVLRRIQRKDGGKGIGKNVILVVKSGCDLNIVYRGVRAIKVSGWLDRNDLRRLYDTSDICLSPSRGGGFELNALEAVSRGVPTLVPNGGCFTDLMQYYIPINVGKWVQPLPSNPIHLGMGPEVDIDDFERKLEDVINRLDYWKGIFRERSVEIREKYTWRNVSIKLEKYLRDYEFIR